MDEINAAVKALREDTQASAKEVADQTGAKANASVPAAECALKAQAVDDAQAAALGCAARRR